MNNFPKHFVLWIALWVLVCRVNKAGLIQKLKTHMTNALPYGLGALVGMPLGGALAGFGTSQNYLEAKQIVADGSLIAADEESAQKALRNQQDIDGLEHVVTEAEDALRDMSSSLSQKVSELQTMVSSRIQHGRSKLLKSIL